MNGNDDWSLRREKQREIYGELVFTSLKGKKGETGRKEEWKKKNIREKKRKGQYEWG